MQSMFRTGHNISFRRKAEGHRGIVKKTCNINEFLFRRKINSMSIQISNGCCHLVFRKVREVQYGTS